MMFYSGSEREIVLSSDEQREEENKRKIFGDGNKNGTIED